tara:strand:- start:889 stop:1386 length:498 start_codon:yes stop_codon:yes gene_type:complete
MATYDHTTGQGTAGHRSRMRSMYVLEKTVDIAAVCSAGGVSALTADDIIQAIDIPAEVYILHAGVEVITALNGTSPVLDVDFAAGDDFVDGASAASTGYCAAGTNGHVDYTAVSTFANRVTATDTIDVKVGAGANDVSTGKIRVYAVLCDISGVDETDSLRAATL